MERNESPASSDGVSWFWVLLILGVIVVIVLCLWCCCEKGVRLRDIPGHLYDRFFKSYGTVPRTLYCQVQSYGQGNVHHEIVKRLNIIEGRGFPLVLFVYKVTRETEDLRNALQWIEGKGEKREDIYAAILLEKCLDKQKKPVEVAHQGMFDANTVAVRILYQQQRNAPDKILDCPSNREAMEKVRWSITDFQKEERFQTGSTREGW
ncbi:uncharacterized protein LOC132393930 isoform X1 [Hypanus sabinus]|uniref:uncharacterized protein LOC132393930 isoform X1 n=1 Tax=Hypanus sabinus TaxID=79690 RepID=UPI0028C4DCFC|nr:uncharacterized protein LOC132393930 isoform X1 [Hypanus sabinus]